MAHTCAQIQSRDEPIERGKACIRCRRRKIRCDGRRPFCSACVRASKTDDCEYTDNQGRTRTQILEETLERLQSRLQELEHPELVRPIALSRPYGGTGEPHFQIPEVLSSIEEGWWNHEEPPTEMMNILINVFMPHASLVGFVLSQTRFTQRLSLPRGNPLRPHIALINAFVLWALHVSNNPELIEHEELYAERTISVLSNTANDYSDTLDIQAISQTHIHIIQASILLACYFYDVGRPLEGQYHTNSAIALVLSASLHRLPMSSLDPGYSKGLVSLSIPFDAVELGERIRIFWIAFIMDRCWSASLGVPCALIESEDGIRIDTPWPYEISDYEKIGNISTIAESFQTVQLFLSDVAPHVVSQEDFSFSLALRAKAASLYEKSTRVISSRQSNINDEVHALANRIVDFARSLRPLDRIEDQNIDYLGYQTGGIAHGLAHSAVIQLHKALSDRTNAALQHSLEIFTILSNIINTGQNQPMNMFLDPIFSIIATTAAANIIREYNSLLQEALTHTSHAQLVELRNNISQIISNLRRASGIRYVHQCFSMEADVLEAALEKGDISQQ